MKSERCVFVWLLNSDQQNSQENTTFPLFVRYANLIPSKQIKLGAKFIWQLLEFYVRTSLLGTYLVNDWTDLSQ